MADITITKGDGIALFSLPQDAPCPRVGEIIHYAFTANNPETWAEDSWKANTELDGTVWRVTHVEHHVLRADWNKSYGSTWVTVKRVPATTRVHSRSKS